MPPRSHNDSVPPHYLESLVSCDIPRRIVSFTAASKTSKVGRQSEHILRCWSMLAVDRGIDGGDASIVFTAFGESAEEFAATLASAALRHKPLYAIAYDTGYVTTLLQVPQALVNLGWQVARFNITSEHVWFKLRNGKKTIIITDVRSYLPEQIGTLADYVQIPLQPKPDAKAATVKEWQEYCWNYVQIVALNMLCCMDFCEKHDLGSWASTGSGIGWNVFRHKFIDHKILLTGDQEARNFERLAIRGGRREVFQTAEWEDGYFADIDIRAAYPTIARNFDLPCKRGARFSSVPSEWHKRRPKGQGVIARCIVESPAPLVPAMYGTTTFYGTGTFATILASPEIDLLHEAGAKVTILEGYRYQLAPIMQSWGKWVTDTIHPSNTDVPPSVRKLVKHWSRSTIGRWTMRYMREDDEFRADPDSPPVEKIGYLKFREEDKFWRDGLPFVKSGAVPIADIEGYLINIDGKPRAFFRDEEPRDAFPAITAWVESICRVLLVKIMAAQPRGRVMQCDTDGYLVGFSARDVLDSISGSFFARPDVDSIWINGSPIPLPEPPEGFELVVKGRYTNVHIRGAQQLSLDGERRMAGVPRNARELEPELLEAEVYPRYVEQLRHGKPGTFVSQDVTFAGKSTIATGWREKSGRIVPVQLRVVDGVNRIMQPKWVNLTTPWRRLAQHQHPVLEQILKG